MRRSTALRGVAGTLLPSGAAAATGCVDADGEAAAVVGIVQAKRMVQWAPAVRQCVRAAAEVTHIAQQVAALRDTAADRHHPPHAAMLDTLWSRLQPGVRYPSPTVGSDAPAGVPTWSDVGFQHPADPTADFRGMGAAGLHFLAHAVCDGAMCRGMRGIIDATDLPTHGYPIAATWMSVLNLAGGVRRRIAHPSWWGRGGAGVWAVQRHSS
jgi:hypothetical protein